MPEIDLSRQVGPLPLGGWILAVGGGVGIVVLMRRGSGGSVLTSNESESETPLEENPGVGIGSPPGYSLYPNEGTYVPPAEEDVIEDNDEWGIKALRWAVENGYTGYSSDITIRNYLAGESLSPADGTLISAIIKAIGPTPMGLPTVDVPIIPTPVQPGTPSPVTPNKPVGTVKKPTPVKAKPKPKYKTHTVKPGDTLGALAKRYGTSVDKIFNANKKGSKRADGSAGILINKNLIRVGQKLIIPQ